MSEMIAESIKKLTSGIDLSREEARGTIREMLSGEVGDAEISGILVAMKMKGETREEIVGFAQGMREMAVLIRPRCDMVVDTCGTGGDCKGTFNISTAAGFIVAGSGVAVAKHGNRSVSSSCGSADVLLELGVNIEMGPDRACECVEVAGIGFLFAPTFHPAMRRVMNARRSLGIPTIFNILGPLANPAGAAAQVLGVNSIELAPLMAEVLSQLGLRRAFVLHGMDGMDEFTLTDETLVCEVDDGSLKRYSLSPEDLGLDRCRTEDLKGGDARDNARIVTGVLSGKAGAALQISLANAAIALVASGKASSWMQGMALCRESVESGEAMRRLELLVEVSNNNGGSGVP